MKKLNSYDDMIIECIEDLKTNKQKQKNILNEKELAKIEANIKTSNKFKQLERELLTLQVKHFERFIKLIVEIRNVGSKNKGYQKRHFIKEFETYLDVKNRLKTSK